MHIIILSRIGVHDEVTHVYPWGDECTWGASWRSHDLGYPGCVQDKNSGPSCIGPANSDGRVAVKLSSPSERVAINSARARHNNPPPHLHNFILALQNLGPPRQFDEKGVVRTRDRFQVGPRGICIGYASTSRVQPVISQVTSFHETVTHYYLVWSRKWAELHLYVTLYTLTKQIFALLLPSTNRPFKFHWTLIKHFFLHTANFNLTP
jgi:hypothetical protein